MKITLIAAVLLLSSPAFAQSILERAAKDQIVDMGSEEPAMRQAFEKARATLDDFLVKSQKPAPGTSSYALKVAVREGPDTEYIWVNQFTWSGSAFSGRLNNEPRIIKGIKPGQLYKFDRAQIVDWTYLDAGTPRTFGNFTACALLSKESPAEAEQFKRRIGLECK